LPSRFNAQEDGGELAVDAPVLVGEELQALQQCNELAMEELAAALSQYDQGTVEEGQEFWQKKVD
jgi:hypothetical protein